MINLFITAILARKLNCPVLSYDSDFYIFDGLYIPYVTVTQKVYKKTISSSITEVEIIPKKQKGQKNIKRKPKKVVIENEEVVESEETYNYLDCCLYQIENLTEGFLDTEMLPLFAILLGNDFISRKWFGKFFVKVQRRRAHKSEKKRGGSPQQKKIFALLNWLKHETLRSAVRKIIECVPQKQRNSLWIQIRNALRGYKMVKCKSFEYFGFTEENFEHDERGIVALSLEEIMTIQEEDEEEEEEDEETQPTEGDENVEETEEKSENEENNENCEELDEDCEEEQSENDEIELQPELTYRRRRTPYEFPEWFAKIYNAGLTPRFVVDIFRCHKYINYPQIEDFHGPDGNTIAYPILNHFYSMLNSPIGHEQQIKCLYYYTRVPKQVRYEVKRLLPETFPDVKYDLNKQKNFDILKQIFNKCFINFDETIGQLKMIPEIHQLYIFSLIYWLKRSRDGNLWFLQAAIIGIIALNVTDKSCGKIHRDAKKFAKNNEKLLKEAKEIENSVPPEELSIKQLMKIVTKSEALLTMENLVSYYEISSKFQRRHADFRKNVVSSYCEFQCVLFNLHAMIPFLNYPFENVKMGNHFNGLFLYNMYLSLKSRANSIEYINAHIFNRSPAMMMIFKKIYEICCKELPKLKAEEISTEIIKPLRIQKKVKKNNNTKLIVNQENIEINVDDDDDCEYDDLNNQFAQLLKIQK
jgi:hypothetical protein